MTDYQPLTGDIIQKLRDTLGPSCMDFRSDVLDEFSRDGSDLTSRPELAIRVQETWQVERLLGLANEYHFPVTPRGAGTGLAGGCLPAHGGVVLSLTMMDRILAIDRKNLIARVEPGVITKDLREAAHRQGLFYPPDPAGLESSTIGGNAATSAGGPSCLKYGTTKDYVLGLEAVLPSGRLIQTGAQTRKGVVGYDLTRLLVGSEGTLGVITGLTLKLIPHVPAVYGLAAAFPDLTKAMAAVTDILVSGHLPSAIEFMDHKCLGLVGDLLPFRPPDGKATLLIIETDGAEEQVQREAALIAEICRRGGATEIIPAPGPAEREKIWEVRRQISLRIHDRSALYLSEDVSVPIGLIADFVTVLPEFETSFGFEIFTFGHAGDGNLHLNLSAASKHDQDHMARGAEAILRKVLQMGGTISGEHGVGKAKQGFLPLELSPESLRLQKEIKNVFDPNQILNPDKIFP